MYEHFGDSGLHQNYTFSNPFDLDRMFPGWDDDRALAEAQLDALVQVLPAIQRLVQLKIGRHLLQLPVDEDLEPHVALIDVDKRKLAWVHVVYGVGEWYGFVVWTWEHRVRLPRSDVPCIGAPGADAEIGEEAAETFGMVSAQGRVR